MSSTSHQPIIDPDGVRWNAGAWFGGQIGGTAWMLTAFVVYAWQAPWLGILFLAGFVAANALGLWLWSNRRRFRFFRSVQLMMLVCGCLALASVLSLDFFAPGDLKHYLIWQGNRPRQAGANRSEFRSAYLMLCLMIPALMIQFEIQGRLAKRGASQLAD